MKLHIIISAFRTTEDWLFISYITGSSLIYNAENLNLEVSYFFLSYH